MSRRTLFIVSAMAAAASMVPFPASPVLEPRNEGRLPPLRQPPPRLDPPGSSPLSVACPRCKAEPGKGCDARTLGSFSHHKARVDLHAARGQG